MVNRKPATNPQTTIVLGMLALLLVVFIILYPDKAFQASLQGLNLWWKLVFPALLPFFILTELMSGLGVLHAIGKLLEPLLRRLLRLPGAGGWAIATGWIAGSPAAAAAVDKLHAAGLVKRHEAERVMIWSHVCSPVFIISVVGVGFLNSGRLGVLLAIVHYISAAAAALATGWLRRGSEPLPPEADLRDKRSLWLEHPDPQANLLVRSIHACKKAQQQDGRTFGKLLGDSVVSSVQNLMAVGGYIMMFSVLINVIHVSGLIEWFTRLADSLGVSSQQAYQWLVYLLPAALEMHIGTYAITQSDMVPAVWQAAILSAAIAWGGFSVHMQVRSLTIEAQIRTSKLLVSRLVHAVIAFLLTLLLWEPLGKLLSSDAPSFMPFDADSRLASRHDALREGLWFFVSPMMLHFAVTMLVALMLSIVLAFVWRSRKSD